MSGHPRASIRPELLLRVPTLRAALVRRNGDVEAATPAFRRLVTGEQQPDEPWSIVPFMLEPSWRALVAPGPAAPSAEWRLAHEGVLNFGRSGDVARSADAVLLDGGDCVLLVAGDDRGVEDLATRVLALNEDLANAQREQARVIRALRRTEEELRAALAQVRTLKGLLPICAHCKRIRDKEDVWHRIESYIAQHTDAEFTHGICTECMEASLRDLDAADG